MKATAFQRCAYCEENKEYLQIHRHNFYTDPLGNLHTHYICFDCKYLMETDFKLFTLKVSLGLIKNPPEKPLDPPWN
jgi:hypothetical protein